MGLKKDLKNTKGVEFDAKLHKYYINGQELTSVTTWLHDYFVPEFNAIFASINKGKKNKSEGAGITNPTILRKFGRLQGERASLIGSATHTFAELYHLDNSIQPETGYEIAVVNAYKALASKWEIVEMEKIVHSADFMLAGCMDLLLKNRETGEIGIGDWKTTTDMHKSYNKMKEEMKGVAASALNKYSLQLQLYNVLGGFGASHTNMFVIQLMNDGGYKVYSSKSQGEDKLVDYSTQLMAALNRRKITHNPLLNI